MEFRLAARASRRLDQQRLSRLGRPRRQFFGPIAGSRSRSRPTRRSRPTSSIRPPAVPTSSASSRSRHPVDAHNLPGGRAGQRPDNPRAARNHVRELPVSAPPPDLTGAIGWGRRSIAKSRRERLGPIRHRRHRLSVGVEAWRSEREGAGRPRPFELRTSISAISRSIIHSAHSAARHGRRVRLRSVGDHRLGRDHEAGDRRRVLQRDPHDLRRIDDAGASISTYCSVWAS